MDVAPSAASRKPIEAARTCRSAAVATGVLYRVSAYAGARVRTRRRGLPGFGAGRATPVRLTGFRPPTAGPEAVVHMTCAAFFQLFRPRFRLLEPAGPRGTTSAG